MRKFNFKKIASVLGSLTLVGSSIGMAIATGAGAYPSSFQNSDKVAIVYGANADVSDFNAGNSLNSNLLSAFNRTKVSVGSNSLTENEIVLGSKLIDNGRFNVSVLTDNKLPSLMDGKINWDDGVNSSTNFNVHEEISLGNMSLITNLDDEDLNATALTNNKDLEYKLVFEDTMDISRIGHEDADTLEISILGKDYEVESFDSNEITVSVADEKIVKSGESFVQDGVTLNVKSIFTDEVQINNVFIGEGKTKTVDGVEVYVSKVAYRDSETNPSVVILKVGKDISRTFSDGDAYPGQDEDNAKWVWSIKNPGLAGGYIGVRYNQREIDAEDDLVYAGEEYTFPENFATVKFDSLTDVKYGKYEVYFDDSMELYNKTSNTALNEDAQVLVLKGTEGDAFKIGQEETDRVYLFIDKINDNNIQVFFNDINKDYGNSAKARYEFTLQGSNTDIGKLVYEDTELSVSFKNSTRELTIGDISLIVNPIVVNGSLTHLGTTPEDAENSEVVLETRKIGTREDDVFSHFGLVLKDVEANANSDRVVFEVPSEQVYGKVTVSDVSGTEVIPLDVVIVKDTEIETVKDRDLVIVGGSCINSVAAKLVGGSFCGADWTTATGIGSGQYLVKEYVSPYNAGKVAFLVAGYEAADTVNAVQSVLA